MDISPAPLRAPLPLRPATLHTTLSYNTLSSSTVSTSTHSTNSSSINSISRPELERSNSSCSSSKTASSFPFLNQLFRSTSSLSSSSSTSSITTASRSTSPETFLNPLLNSQTSETRNGSRTLSPGLELEEIDGQWSKISGRCQPHLTFSANVKGTSGESESDGEVEELKGEMRPPSSM